MPADRRESARRIAELALASSRAPATEVTVTGESDALTRFASSSIHQNLARRQLRVSIRVCDGGRMGRAVTTRSGADELARTAQRAWDAARTMRPDPNLQPLPDPAPIPDLDRFDPAAAEQSPTERAEAVTAIVRSADAAKATAAGAATSGAFFTYLANSRGLTAWGEFTQVGLSATVTRETATGYAEQSGWAASALAPAVVGERASGKAARGLPRRDLPPGRYTAILEPPAVAEMMFYLLYGHGVSHWSALGIAEGRSFLAGRMGTRVFGSNVTILDDPWHPLQCGLPFDAEGVPRTPLTLVEAGVAKAVTCDRATAARLGTAPTGHGLPLPNPLGSAPQNLVMTGSTDSLEDLIAGCDRGILVTRLWYNRLVDPAQLIVTGLTRDGTFLVEGGRIVSAVRNFRINQSVREMLESVVAASRPERAGGMVVPALVVEGFHFAQPIPDDPPL